MWPLWTSVTLVAVVTLLVGGGCAAATVLLRMPVVMRRGMAWTVTWVAALLGGVKVGILLDLLDTTDPMASGSATVDDAATAAATLVTLADRHHARSDGPRPDRR